MGYKPALAVLAIRPTAMGEDAGKNKAYSSEYRLHGSEWTLYVYTVQISAIKLKGIIHLCSSL
jgi:hypothetical protein